MIVHAVVDYALTRPTSRSESSSRCPAGARPPSVIEEMWGDDPELAAATASWWIEQRDIEAGSRTLGTMWGLAAGRQSFTGSVVGEGTS